MKFFTKSLVMLAMMTFGVGSAFAEDIIEDLTLDMFKKYDGWGINAQPTGQPSGAELNLNKALEAGNVVCGTGGVFGTVFVNLDGYSKIIFTGTPGEGKNQVQLRVMFNRLGDGDGTLIEKQPIITLDNPTVEVKLDEVSTEYVHLVAVKINWGNAGTITSIKLVKPDDPFAQPRSNLKKAINNAKNYSLYGKTESSAEALEEAVKSAEEELKVGDSQYESISAGVAKINAAKDAIDAAIAGLELKWGYFSLTKEMFNNPNCTYDLHKEATDCAYGNGGVGAADYADLSNYDQLIISVASGAARVYYNFDGAAYKPCINVATGETKVIDIPADANDYFHLNAIKAGSWGAKVVISEALAYIDFDNMDANEAVKANRQMLKDAIDQANAVDLENVTSESAAAMKEALAAAMALIFKRGDITMVPTMDAARRNLLEAIENLVEAYKFDASFYHNWSEVSATAEDKGVAASGGVKLNEDVAAGGAFWGNLSGAVPYLDYANITDYSELRFEGTPGAQLRLMCNRLVDEGPIFEKIYTIGSDGRLTVKISDLKFLNGGTPCDFVCLQAIKVPWGGSTCKLTSIQILKGGADEPVVTGLQTVKAAAEGDAIYSISGQRLAQPKKGLNIINGKKVVIK